MGWCFEMRSLKLNSLAARWWVVPERQRNLHPMYISLLNAFQLIFFQKSSHGPPLHVSRRPPPLQNQSQNQKLFQLPMYDPERRKRRSNESSNPPLDGINVLFIDAGISNWFSFLLQPNFILQILWSWHASQSSSRKTPSEKTSPLI